MRRKDREVTDMARIMEIVQQCDCCRLGIQDGEGVYIVPLNYACVHENGATSLYFHCAREGKKLDLLRANPVVGFEMDTAHQLVSGEKACDFTFRFSSVIGTGIASPVVDAQEKIRALSLIVGHFAPDQHWNVTEAQAQGVTVVRVDVREMTAKENQ